MISPALLLGLSPIAIVLTLLASIMYGAKSMDWTAVRDAFLNFDPGNVDHQIVLHSRLPRAAGSLLIGGFLAMSGAIMQGMTRNYLASPSIMGVTDGAAFAITLCMVLLPNASSMTLIASSFAGSALGASVVFILAWMMPGGLSPVRMAILGTIIGTFLSSVSAALSIYFHVSQNVSFWFNARLHQMDPGLIKLVIPFAVVGIAVALMLAKSITIISLGDDIAAGLGQRTLWVKIGAMCCVAVLTGVSVAMAGKIAFVGLLIPHIVRYLVGVDYRWVIPCAGVTGAVFLGLSDILSRFLNYPFETPIGVVTSAVGIPFFLYLIRKKGGNEHA
ncbi:MAG: ferrichrome transporter permease [Paenibacillaceae bacterium]|nr:ferrichrome transporter permease [Paenibacillaceae bacterium]